MHVYVIYKDVIDSNAGKQRRHICKEQTFELSGRRWGILENSTEACTLLYVKEMISVSLRHEAGHPKENLEG